MWIMVVQCIASLEQHELGVGGCKAVCAGGRAKGEGMRISSSRNRLVVVLLTVDIGDLSF